ncbi:MAG: hypothetical protein D3923_10010 [Candidatus Electrothrix sp. AR3]|nr:hypothetical protein [Candidatus Electrothrix sp. AR3]
MSNRSAIDTIKGYFYQFDCSIEKLLTLPDDNDEITVEGIEDIDIETSTETTAIQCKYYSKTEYNHSVIAKPIRLMLSHYKDVKTEAKPLIKYHLYGFYNSGQNKLSLPLDIAFLKEKFLTYKLKGVQKRHHDELGLKDVDLCEFLKLLSIDIHAKKYSVQHNAIILLLNRIFSCDNFEAEYYFYNNALNEIRKLSIKDNESDRKIKKKDFINSINLKQLLFNKWFLELKGERIYHKELKDKYFRKLNKSPFERFFLIDLPDNCLVSELKDLVFILSNRYSNLKKREPRTYCPYIYFNNLIDSKLLELKRQLFNEDFNFIDGFPFFGSDFSAKSISIKADSNNGIKVKLLGSSAQIYDTLKYINKTKEVYQFYFDDAILPDINDAVKNVCVQIASIENIKEIV